MKENTKLIKELEEQYKVLVQRVETAIKNVIVDNIGHVNFRIDEVLVLYGRLDKRVVNIENNAGQSAEITNAKVLEWERRGLDHVLADEVDDVNQNNHLIPNKQD